MKRWFCALLLSVWACDSGGDAAADALVLTDGASIDADLTDGSPPADAQPRDAAEGDQGVTDQGVAVDAQAPDAVVDERPAAWVAICAACHGPQGEGTQLGYELRHPVVSFANWVVRHGRTGGQFPVVMEAYPSAEISDRELSEIWSWLGSFPQPTTGEGLYLDYCANCHGENGRGGVVGVSLRGESAVTARRVRLGENVGNFGQRGGYMPAFNTTLISDAELALIVQHVATF